MTCRACGAQIADKAIVCYKCGTPTADEAALRPAARQRPAGTNWLAVALVVLVLLALAALGWAVRDAPAGSPARWLAWAGLAVVGIGAVVVWLRRR